MNEARPFASLSSGLLARKGAAKPAMRPQGFGQIGSGLEDLGWNDLGQVGSVDQDPQQALAEELPEHHVPSSIAALTPAPRSAAPVVEEPAGEPEAPEPAPEPQVIEQQRSIAENLGVSEEEAAAEAEEEPARRADVVKLPPRPAPAPKGRKSAFTLRLDPERHLRLRLACAVSGRSAQQIVTGALDEWLKSIPEVETLAERAACGRPS